MMTSADVSDESGARVGPPMGFHVSVWLLLPAIGLGMGLLVSRIPGWVAALPWFPNQSRIAELADVVGFRTALVLGVIGLLAGVFLALVSYDAITSAFITPQRIDLTVDGHSRTFRRHTVQDIFREDGQLVILDTKGAELLRYKSELDVGRLREALHANGYVWRDADPYEDAYARWADGSTGLSQDEHALLRVRREALASGDSSDQVELREELASCGIVIRDRGKKQYWRRVAVTSDPSGQSDGKETIDDAL